MISQGAIESLHTDPHKILLSQTPSQAPLSRSLFHSHTPSELNSSVAPTLERDFLPDRLLNVCNTRARKIGCTFDLAKSWQERHLVTKVL